jgi:hypothetical protein
VCTLKHQSRAPQPNPPKCKFYTDVLKQTGQNIYALIFFNFNRFVQKLPFLPQQIQQNQQNGYNQQRPIVTSHFELNTRRPSFECGKVKIGTTLSLGSEESRPGQWPWYAPIFRVEKNEFIAGSSIISKNYLLTGKTNELSSTDKFF